MLTLLRAACQGREDLPLATFDAAHLQWALESGLGPLLFHATKHDPKAATSPFWPLLQGADLTARVVTGTQVEAMEDILDACAGRVPPLTLLKGISIGEQYYPQPHLRLMRDLDILVDEAAVPTVEAVLSTIGYRQQSSRPPAFFTTHHHSMPFRHPARRLWVEVHRGLFPPASRLGRDRLFRQEIPQQERRPSAFQGHAVFRLSPELQLVYIAAHWAMGFQPIGGLIALLDATYLLQRTAGTLDWGRLLAWLEGSAAAAPLHLLLTYLDASHLVALPPELLPQLRTRQHAPSPTRVALAHGLVNRYFVAGHPRGRILRTYGWLLWQTLLLGPGAPAGKLLRAPRRWLVASRLGRGGRLSAAAGHEGH